MILRSALGGPGPCTLAYRQSRNLIQCSTLPPFRTLFRPTSDVQQSQRRASNSTAPACAAAASRKLVPQPDIPHVIPLPAPPDQRKYHLPLQYLRDAIRERDLYSAARAYGEILSWNSVDKLSDDDWEGLSQVVGAHFNQQQSIYKVGRIYLDQPELYGWMSTMTIDAASRGHWLGLYWLLLSLIGAGRPQAVVDACNRYRTNLYHIQDKNPEDAKNNWDRQTRLSARLTGDGILPIYTINIAAFTMLDQLDAPNILRLFNTKANWTKQNKNAISDIHSAFSFLPDTKRLFQQFQDGYDKLLFALLCYHPSSMRDRLRATALGAEDAVAGFNTWYQSLLEGSIGPHKFLRPLALNDESDGRDASDIVIPPATWKVVIQCLGKRCQAAEIFRLIDVILPERDLPPTPFILGAALEAIGRIQLTRKASAHDKEVAAVCFEQLIGYIDSCGLGDADEVLSAKLDLQSVLGAHEAMDEAYNTLAAQGVRRDVGPQTRASLARIYVHFSRFDRAIEVLRWTGGPTAKPQNPRPYMAFMQAIYERGSPAAGRNRLSTRQMMKAIADALRIQPKDISKTALNSAYPVLLVVASDPDRGFEGMLKAIHTSQTGPLSLPASFNDWKVVMQVTVTHFVGAHHTTPNEAEVGLRLLRAFAKSDMGTTLGNITRTDRLWDIYLAAVAKSHPMSVEQRRQYMMAALAAHPNDSGVRKTSRFRMISAVLSRQDKSSLEDALFWWDHMEKNSVLTQFWWGNMMDALKRTSNINPAVKLLKQCWEQDKVPKRASFWDSMVENGLLAKCEISKEDLDEAREAKRAQPRPQDFETMVEDPEEAEESLIAVEDDEIEDEGEDAAVARFEEDTEDGISATQSGVDGDRSRSA